MVGDEQKMIATYPKASNATAAFRMLLCDEISASRLSDKFGVQVEFRRPVSVACSERVCKRFEFWARYAFDEEEVAPSSRLSGMAGYENELAEFGVDVSLTETVDA